jgi:hypothetical protein
METPDWRRIGCWLLVLPISVAGFLAAYVGSQFLMLLSNVWVRELDGTRLNVPIHRLLALQSVLIVFGVCALWFVPTAIALGFAAGLRWRTALVSGTSAALALTGV